MAFVCAACTRQLQRRAFAVRRRAIRTYSTQSVEHILDPSYEDDLAVNLDDAFKASRSWRGKPPKHQEKQPSHTLLEERELERNLLGIVRDRQHRPLKSRKSEPMTAEAEDKGDREVAKLLDRHDYKTAWTVFLALGSDRDITSRASRSHSKTVQRQLLTTFASRILEAIRLSKATTLELPSISQLWRDLRDLGVNEGAALNHAWVVTGHYLDLYYDGHDIFSTEHRRRYFMELLQFWLAWIREAGLTDTGMSTDEQGKRPEESKIDLSTWCFVDERKNAKAAPSYVHLAVILPFLLEHGLASSVSSKHFCGHESYMNDMNALISTIRWSAARRNALFAAYKTHKFGDEGMKLRSWINTRIGDQEASNCSGLATNATMPESIVEYASEDVEHQNDAPATAMEELAAKVPSSLGHLIESQNLRMLEQHWEKTKKLLEASTAEERNSEAIGAVYNEYLYAFRALRVPKSTIEVWNHMVSNGVRPTIKTWNVMLKACHIGREVDAMEAIWRRMVQSGQEPNDTSWGTRVHGLFKFNRVSEGFAALYELSATHQAAAKIKNGLSGPAPSLSILNNALSGGQRHGPDCLGRILTWGVAQSISPDLVTYNILLNAALHSGRRKQARAIISHMASKSIRPDGATFTILLHALFQDGYLSDLSPEEQEKQALGYINSLESDGLQLDQRGYALLLDRLLKECKNPTAANAVLAHMVRRKVAPTAHIYTILITHYFAQDPPNVAAVEAVWQRLSASRRGAPSSPSSSSSAADVILYDRLVEGFARAGEVGRMMFFLGRMGKEGKRPGWIALTEALRCLLRKGEAQRAAELVADVVGSCGPVSDGARGRGGSDEFWEVVEKAGIPLRG